MKAVSRTSRWASIVVLVLSVVACGGGGGAGGVGDGSALTMKGIVISPTNSQLIQGKTLQYSATAVYSDGSGRDISSTVTWLSSDSGIASVNSAGLVSALQGGTANIYAQTGGMSAWATMQVVVPQATETILHWFDSLPNEDLNPSSLIQGPDGNLYGQASSTLFKMSLDGTETILHAFSGAPSDGSGPGGVLIFASDGNMYGTTDSGGAYDKGTVFRLTPAGDYSVLYSFGATAADGTAPNSLMQGSDGNLYGTTWSGGVNTCENVLGACGTAFKLTLAGVESVIYQFGASVSDGWRPNGLVQGPDGNLYGTAPEGGANSNCSCGTVFMLTPTGVETTLHSFGSLAVDGFNPYGPLVLGPDGSFYGTTIHGGSNDANNEDHCYVLYSCGTVFKITPAGQESVLYAFGSYVDDGNTPGPYLAFGRDGNLYGTTSVGGANGFGTAFRLTPAGMESVIYSFGATSTDAITPQGTLIQASDGAFYVLTSAGANGVAVQGLSGSVVKLQP